MKGKEHLERGTYKEITDKDNKEKVDRMKEQLHADPIEGMARILSGIDVHYDQLSIMQYERIILAAILHQRDRIIHGLLDCVVCNSEGECYEDANGEILSINMMENMGIKERYKRYKAPFDKVPCQCRINAEKAIKGDD